MPFSNGFAGTCAAAEGVLTLVAKDGATLNFRQVGILCEQDTSGSPLVFNGTYQFSTGTGRFANASGSGRVSLGDDRAGNVHLHVHGTINY